MENLDMWKIEFKRNFFLRVNTFTKISDDAFFKINSNHDFFYFRFNDDKKRAKKNVDLNR